MLRDFEMHYIYLMMVNYYSLVQFISFPGIVYSLPISTLCFGSHNLSPFFYIILLDYSPCFLVITDKISYAAT